MTINQEVAKLSNSVKQQLKEGAKNGESISSMANKFKLKYEVIQAHLWQSGTLTWQGAKTIITRRLSKVENAITKEGRSKLVNEIQEQIDYLYYAARQLQKQLERVKKSLPSGPGPA